jgi:hypothetical protein
MEPEREEKPATLYLNVNIFRFNLYTMLICIALSYFKNDYEYVNSVYNCLVTLFIYNNMIFLYVVYNAIKETWNTKF